MKGKTCSPVFLRRERKKRKWEVFYISFKKEFERLGKKIFTFKIYFLSFLGWLERKK